MKECSDGGQPLIVVLWEIISVWRICGKEHLGTVWGLCDLTVSRAEFICYQSDEPLAG